MTSGRLLYQGLWQNTLSAYNTAAGEDGWRTIQRKTWRNGVSKMKAYKKQ